MAAAVPTLEALAAGLRAAWTAGDFGQIARYDTHGGPELVRRLGLGPGERVLDLRHARVRQLVRSTKSLPLAQKQAGWSRLQMAYLTIGDDEARELRRGVPE